MSTPRKHGFIRRAGLPGLFVVFVIGILFWVAFNAALDWTNREEFCLSCHEMKNNVYREYQETIHYMNRSGVRATCPDCHVPKELGPKLVRKFFAVQELWGKYRGTIDTPEKFAARRPQLAENEWKRMRANNSQECRNCHDPKSFDYGAQSYRSVNQHTEGLDNGGKICIDCHQGIAHHLPDIDQGIGH
jgi:cytochrome c-type protein NapC